MVAIVAVGALLGGSAAFAATLAGPAPGPVPAASIAPGAVTGTLAPGRTGVAPHPARSGSGSGSGTGTGTGSGTGTRTRSGHSDTRQARPGPWLTRSANPPGSRPAEPRRPSPPTRIPARRPIRRPASAPTRSPAAVTGYLTGRAGTVAAAVYDVTTGQTWTLGPGSPQATGSLVKVDILQALLGGRRPGLSAADLGPGPPR